MATTKRSIITQARAHLIAPVATETFWTDAELLSILDNGIADLWRAVNDNYQNYFLTIDTTNVSMAASSGQLTGVPSDCAIVRGIEPASLSDFPYLKFEHRQIDHRDFTTARSQQTLDPNYARTIFFAVRSAGAPVSTPIIDVAPLVSVAIPLRFTYVPVLTRSVYADLDATPAAPNPIPGESDQALINWLVAYAKAKQNESGAPDAGWLQMYGTEKQNMLVSLSPRQTQDEDVAEGIFEEYW